MIRFQVFFIALIASLSSCGVKESLITIIDISDVNRVELGKQLKLISEYSPKIVALDYFLVPDSAGVDIGIVEGLSKLKNTVQCVALHENLPHTNNWDSVEVSNSKFKPTHFGFSNISISDDSVFIPELPVRQYYRDDTIYSFGYVVAENSVGVKEEYKANVDKDFTFDIAEFEYRFKIISTSDLMSRNFKPQDLNDKIVVLGYIGGKEDDFYIDDKRTKKINGVEIQANFIRLIMLYSQK